VATITLHSPLAPVALATRLRDVLGDSSARPAAGVTGRGSEQDMRLWVYRPNLQNSFQTGLKATLDAEGGGTRITGTLGPPASAKLFMVVWFGFLGIFVVAGGVAMLAAGASPLASAPFVGFPLGMMAFGGGLWKLGTWNDRKDRAAILHFLADTVQAREA
jgi:hypothetical protein